MRYLDKKFKSNPLVSLIVLTHNHEEVMLECLRAIGKFTKYPSFEVVIVDNGSCKESLKKLTGAVSRFRAFPIRIIKLPTNLGYSVANNIGAKRARGEILIFLNNDVVVTPGWFKPLVDFFADHPGGVCCAPKIHSYKNPDFFDYAGGAGGYLDMFGYPFVRGRVFDSIERDKGQYDSEREITWATGACLVVLSKAFRKVGGFDEYFFAYFEEIDLCVRLRMMGYKIFSIPASTVYHYGAYTNNANLSQKIFNNHHNHLYFFLKNYSLWPYFPIILARILLDGCSIIYYFGEFKLGYVYAVLRAYLKLFLEIPHLVERGVITFSGRSLLSDRLIFKRSVVLDYFVLGRKNFAQIIDGKSPKRINYKRYRDITYFG